MASRARGTFFNFINTMGRQASGRRASKSVSAGGWGADNDTLSHSSIPKTTDPSSYRSQLRSWKFLYLLISLEQHRSASELLPLDTQNGFKAQQKARWAKVLMQTTAKKK